MIRFKLFFLYSIVVTDVKLVMSTKVNRIMQPAIDYDQPGQ